MANLKFPFSSILRKKIIIPLVILALVVGSGIVIFLASKGMSSTNSNDPEADVKRTIEEIGKIYLLPEEVPTFATVSDKNQLADQVFFQKAENGDKLLIYRTAKVAILYRPSVGKIVNVGPLNLTEEGLEPRASTTPREESDQTHEEELSDIDVLILNGTSTVGLTQNASEDLSDLELVTIVDRLDAENKPYEKTSIVVLTSAASKEAEAISEIIPGEIVREMPDGESGTSADIVIILGEDYVSPEEE